MYMYVKYSVYVYNSSSALIPVSLYIHMYVKYIYNVHVQCVYCTIKTVVFLDTMKVYTNAYYVKKHTLVSIIRISIVERKVQCNSLHPCTNMWAVG